jgi:hypothetical protein
VRTLRGEHRLVAWARSAPAFRRRARSARQCDPAATGARARSAHAIGAARARVTRGDATGRGWHSQWQCAAALSGCPTHLCTVPPAPVHDSDWGRLASCLLAHSSKQEGSPALALTPQCTQPMIGRGLAREAPAQLYSKVWTLRNREIETETLILSTKFAVVNRN